MAKETKQDFGIEPVTGKNPQEVAKKFIDGDLPNVKDGYDGYQNGSSSLVNNATIKTDKKKSAEEDL